MSSTSTAAVGFRSERGPVLISPMLSTGLVAVDSTVLATAVPSIVGVLVVAAATALAVVAMPRTPASHQTASATA